jgi:[ribosomal protein S5]-alanine N-acetyltransferase
MRDYFLTSPRLGFGTWTAADLPLATALWGDPAVTRYHGGAWSADQIQTRLNQEIASLHQSGVQYWPLFQRDTGEHVGCCGLHPHDPAAGIWELGCHLKRAFWSLKLGREAARAVIAHRFTLPQTRAIRAGHHPSNEASKRFLQSLGFRHTHDEFYPPSQMIEPYYLLTREAGIAAPSSL